MATHIRVTGYHADASGNKARHQYQEQFLLSVNTVGSDGRPDPNSINTVLSGNGKLKGSQFIVTSYVNLDRDQDNSVNILT